MQFLHEFPYLSHPGDPRDDEARARASLEDQPEPINPELAFLEDDPEAPVFPLTPFDFVAQQFADFGIPLPETLCDELRDRPYSQAIKRLRNVLAEAIAEAMARAVLYFIGRKRTQAASPSAREGRDGPA